MERFGDQEKRSRAASGIVTVIAFIASKDEGCVSVQLWVGLWGS